MSRSGDDDRFISFFDCHIACLPSGPYISFFVVHMRLLLALSDVVAKPLRVSLYELPTASSCYGFFFMGDGGCIPL